MCELQKLYKEKVKYESDLEYLKQNTGMLLCMAFVTEVKERYFEVVRKIKELETVNTL